MLRAYSGMPAQELIAQLRVYVIAMGLGPAVVDCVDDLVGSRDLEDAHIASETKIEEEAEERGRENMKDDIINFITKQLDDSPDLSGEAVLALVEKAFP